MRPRRDDLIRGAILGGVVLLNLLSQTGFSSPPRYDGSGYAILAKSLRIGQGYREISHPLAPRHAHFPPGYPVALALVSSIFGWSFMVAHAFSVGCTLCAVLLFWRWFASMYSPMPAFLMGLALAVNWTWGRTGGAIQSEPLFFLLTSLVLVISERFTSSDQVGERQGSYSTSSPTSSPTNRPRLPRPSKAFLVAGLLAGCVLTRHVGVCLVIAVVIDWALRGARRNAGFVLVGVIGLLIPWATWLAIVGQRTQVGLIPRDNLRSLIVSQSLFYVRRIPDQLIGPFVEVATVFGQSNLVSTFATLGALLFTSMIIYGWSNSLNTPRKRLVGLVPLVTLALLLVWPFTEAGRFLIPLVPFLLMGGVESLGRVLTRFPKLIKPLSLRSQAALILLILSLPYSGYAMITRRTAAQERTHADFDAACQFLAPTRGHPGPVLARHPGDVYWLAGRQGLEPPNEPNAMNALIDEYKIAYLLIDESRYARAEAGPLASFVAANPGRVKLVWERPSVSVYEVVTSWDVDLQK